MAKWITVTPSYGRDYPSGKAALADWNAGKDFTMTSGTQQVSKTDVAGTGTRVIIRYKRSTMTVQVP